MSKLNTTQFLDACRINRRTLLRYVREGVIEPVEDLGKGTGNGYRWLPEQVEQLKEEMRALPATRGAAGVPGGRPQLGEDPATFLRTSQSKWYRTSEKEMSAKIATKKKTTRGGTSEGRSKPPAPDSPPSGGVLFTAGQARDCFEHFKAGGSLRDAVIGLALHPNTVQAVWDAYLKLDQEGAVYVSRRVLKKIGALALDGPALAKSEDDLLEIMRLAASNAKQVSSALARRGRTCSRCGRECACYGQAVTATTASSTALPTSMRSPDEGDDLPEDEEPGTT